MLIQIADHWELNKSLSMNFRYEFYYQELIGNSEPLADYVSFENVVLTFDDDSAPTKVYATFTPFALNKIYRVSYYAIIYYGFPANSFISYKHNYTV